MYPLAHQAHPFSGLLTYVSRKMSIPMLNSYAAKGNSQNGETLKW